MKILIIAGEASGDLLGAQLMQDLKKVREDVQFIGIGGEKMVGAGLTTLASMEVINVMGVAEVLPKLSGIKAVLGKVKRVLAEDNEIGAVITIDAQDFSKRVAKLARKIRPEVKRIQYVCPKVWAWRSGRAKHYATLFDKILCVLPFEPDYFNQYKPGVAVFVGHPVMERLGRYVPQTVKVHETQQVGFMVGSRAQEIRRHWPLYKAVFAELRALDGAVTGVIPLVKAEDAALLGEIPEGMEIVVGEERYGALARCRAAVSKSGTGNLELAVMGVPMVVGYKTSAVTYAVVKRLLQIPYVSLVNWIAQAQIVPELLQDDFAVEGVLRELVPLLEDNGAWLGQAEKLANVRTKLAVAEGLAAREVMMIL